MQIIPSLQRLVGYSLLAAAAALTGCATTMAPPAPPDIEETSRVLVLATPEFIPVVRYGRYTLVELAPAAAQRDLLLQIVDVSMPEDVRATVGDGLRHALKRSGYQLCETAHTAIELYSLPLPAAHLHLGPMTLRDTLITLAGPAWDLHADDRNRQVCFVSTGAKESETTTNSELPAPKAAQTFPLAGGQP
ncbi:PFGI-1 class ICE element type IV pilus protein PilL2 [Pseudomonas veronii]|uniref:PFGI-1 class ICE element type IV pilus protein PilL2 n=1 Tax=Pseudomonas veronii TaxID=76761 RepID=UPI0006260A79